MARRHRGLAVAVAVTCAVSWMGAGPGVAQEATTAEADGVVAVIGDSLVVQARDQLPHRVWARNGRELAGSPKLVRRIARIAEVRVLVIAVGSVDVANHISRAEMRDRIDRVIAEVASVPCVLFVDVKVAGVSPWYNGDWERDASRWNEALAASGEPVANWNGVAQQHDDYFLGDGIHFTDVGTTAYADFLSAQVSTHCP